MNRWLILCLCIAILVPVNTAVAGQGRETPVNAVATIGMIGDVVENIGGDCVDVTTLMGPGVDPHLYQASARDVEAFRRADVIFYAGYALEGRLGRVLERFGRQKPTVPVSSASVDKAELIPADEYAGVDPHLWMDVSLWARIVPTIAEQLGEMHPACADRIDARAESYRQKLTALHGWVAEAVATIPEEQRYLVTAHDAFEYYGRAYGLEVVGIQGISTDAEAGVADIRDTASLVADAGVPALFVESTINPRTVQAVVEATRQRGFEVEIGGELYSDAMGPRGEHTGTYLGMIRQNTVTIVTALGGSPPALPEALDDWIEKWGI